MDPTEPSPPPSASGLGEGVKLLPTQTTSRCETNPPKCPSNPPETSFAHRQLSSVGPNTSRAGRNQPTAGFDSPRTRQRRVEQLEDHLGVARRRALLAPDHVL